jgi:hypothetical protein
MIRSFASKTFVTTVVASLALGALFAAPGSAHDTDRIGHNWRRHYRPLAKEIFYTKGRSDARFVNLGEEASDAALFDGQPATAFAEAAHVHGGDDITSGIVDESVIDVLIARVDDVFDIVLAADGSGSGLDADLLDGLSADAFAVSGLSTDARWFKESADLLPSTATSERVVFTAPEDVTITDVFLEPAAALTANDTSFATLLVSRRDATGGNRTTVASASTATSGSGGTGSWSAFSAVSLGPLSNTSLNEGEKLTIEVSKSGLGVSLPVLVLQVEYTID